MQALDFGDEEENSLSKNDILWLLYKTSGISNIFWSK